MPVATAQNSYVPEGGICEEGISIEDYMGQNEQLTDWNHPYTSEGSGVEMNVSKKCALPGDAENQA